MHTQLSEKRGAADLTRRVFLQAGAMTAGALITAGAAAAEPEEGQAISDTANLIDAHVHVWTPDTNKYLLATGYRPTDMQPRSFTPDELLTHCVPCGVGRIVLIQMSFYGFDNSYMLDVIHQRPAVFSGVAVIDENAPDVEATMRKLAKQQVRGFRIHPGQQAVEKWISSAGMAAMWRAGAAENLKMCALINPAALPLIDRMCERYPDTPVVIDHFARIGVDGTIHDADLKQLCRLARHKRTYVKASAFYALGKKQAPYDDLGPMIRRVLDAFGAERVMWASDCPFQVQGEHTYQASLDLPRTRLDFLTDSDRDWLLRKTAQRVLFD